jgi:molybdopterin/thiamine biosynthesis adenylyltransferase/rhodanese-related sulfurtransferase
MTSYHDRVAAAKAQITEVAPDEALRRMSTGAVLIDVREPLEVEQAPVVDAVLLPMRTVLEQIGHVVPDTDTDVLVLCAVGSRSALVAQALTGMGYRSVASVEGGVSRWVDEGLPLRRPTLLDAAERRRYDRHLVLPEVGESGQRRLLDASVTVVGAGGLGSPVSMYLAAAGVGTITLIDDDVVDISNLQRQIVHTDARIGDAKVESAATTIHALNPDITVELRNVRLDSGNVLDLIGGADVIVDCGDNFPTRYLLNDASMYTDTPVVHGSVLRFEGQVSVFSPYRGPCYRCLYPLPPPPELAQSCSDAGVLGVLPGVVGTLQATEALKLILGVGEPLVGRLLVYDALDQTMRTYTVTRNPRCPACADRSAPPPLVDYDEACRPVGVGAAG